jgi:hypothetical protein
MSLGESLWMRRHNFNPVLKTFLMLLLLGVLFAGLAKGREAVAGRKHLEVRRAFDGVFDDHGDAAHGLVVCILRV